MSSTVKRWLAYIILIVFLLPFLGLILSNPRILIVIAFAIAVAWAIVVLIDDIIDRGVL